MENNSILTIWRNTLSLKYDALLFLKILKNSQTSIKIEVDTFIQ